MTNTAIQFIEVSKSYEKNPIVRNLNLQIPKGKLVTLIGPSGCGKTTTLKMINRLIEPTTGRITVNGEDINRVNAVELRRQIGYVIQQIGLFPHMTIEENITLVPKLKKEDSTTFRKRVEELLDLVGMDPARFRSRYPRELSGGQQQRIGVARALAADPSIILMDEPFSALDPISREQLQDELVKLQNTLHKTIVFVTHDMDEALKIADEIVLMKEGVIVQRDVPDQILRHPKNEFVREFVGEKRFIHSSLLSKAKDALTKAITVSPMRGLAECIQLMRRHQVNGLIVTDQQGRYLGVIGANEIYAHYNNEGLKAKDVMSKDVEPIHSETPMQDVLPLLNGRERGFIPVTDQTGKLVGVVTRASVLNVLADTLMEEAEGA
ncbi:ABC transporter ATP-binding protein [Laceyella putida]|uniref:Quaternary amine transport ATP-binding protein n=1 Tax=Laceyella putida TaxID=110101 RepID=A0ABW2RG03_9BACL